jgi:hypothetical protein
MVLEMNKANMMRHISLLIVSILFLSTMNVQSVFSSQVPNFC